MTGDRRHDRQDHARGLLGPRSAEGFSKRQETEDDVEGHSLSRRRDADGEGFDRAKVTPEGFSKRKATEDDVEGHSLSRRRDADGEGFNRAKVTGEGFNRAKATGEDDVEGHSILDPFAARELARARERDIQQNAKRHEFERDAREAKKGRS